MGKYILVSLISFMVCSCANLSGTNVNCSDLVSPPIDIKSKSLQLEMSGGKLINALSIYYRSGSFDTHAYAAGCKVELKRDISSIESLEPKLEKITFKNGNVVKGNYGLTSYFWKVVSMNEDGSLSEIKGGLEKPPGIKKITVTDRAMSENETLALKEMKELYEKDLSEVLFRKEQERIENQKKLYQEEENKAAEKAASRIRKRETARQTVSNNQNIGYKICKNGELKYKTNYTYVVMGQVHYREHSEDGQVVAFLEGMSPDGYKIQFRTNGWATPLGRLQYEPIGYPTIDGINTQPGGIFWDDVTDWFLCDK